MNPFMTPVDEFYRKCDLREELNKKYSSFKTEKERIEFLNSIRSYMDPLSAAISKSSPELVGSIAVY